METYEKDRRDVLRWLDAHVQRFAGADKQGTKAWLAKKSSCIGGSEIAALIGLNPYSNRARLLLKKAGLDTTVNFGIACWWGTMFEPVTENLLARTFRTPVIGTDIHIRCEELPAHANSPDGYAAVPFARPFPDEAGPAESFTMCFDLEAAIARGDEVIVAPALIELKAPYSRIPNGKVPKYYVPQLLSGMALSPPTAVGVYAEVVYRLCALDELCFSSNAYCKNYHDKDARTANKLGGEIWQAPLAIGMTAFYAPKPGTRAARRARATEEGKEVKFNDDITLKGCDQVCTEMLAKSCGCRINEVRPGDASEGVMDIGEIADSSKGAFDQLMSFVNSREVTVQHSLPHMADDFTEDRPASLSEFMVRAEAPPDEHHYLLGFLGWKVFQADFHQIPKQHDFVESVLREPVEAFMRDLSAIRAAENPLEEYRRITMSAPVDTAETLRKTGLDAHLGSIFEAHRRATAAQ